jgi:hypothetical protein
MERATASTKLTNVPILAHIAFGQFWSYGDAGPDRNHARMSLLRSA